MVRRKSVAKSFTSRSSVSSRTRSSIETPSKASRPPVSHRKKRIDRAYMEIRHYQKTTRLLLPKLPFSRLVREIVLDLFPRLGVLRIQPAALEALQESMEMYMVNFFEDAILLTLHAKRVTLYPEDLRLLRRLRGRDDIVNR